MIKGNGHNITDNRLVMPVLDNLPKEYTVMIIQLPQVLGEKNLTVQKLCTQLKLFYTTLKKANNWSNPDTALNRQHFTPKKSFKGKCSACRKHGHKSADCGEKEKMHQNGPQVGPLHEEHQDMVYVSISLGDVICAVNLDTKQLTAVRNDKINVVGNAMDLDQEHVLVADMLIKYNKLEDNTWLCDSGATCHLMNNSIGV